MGNSSSSRHRDRRQRHKSNAHAHDNTTHCTQDYSDRKIGDMSNSSSNTINVGARKEPSGIQAWLSPLEPYERHQDVSDDRLDGVGDWVLRRDEFESWCRSQNSPVNPTLLCCGGEGVGKTYIRYKSVFQKP